MGRLLLVDGDQDLCPLMERLLAAEGFLVTPVYDGESGLAAALQGGFDLVLLDVILPDIDGFTVLESIRQKSSVPVVLVTALGDHSSRVRGLVSGADDYVVKPFDPVELSARIRAILRRSMLPRLTAQQTVCIENVSLDPRARTVHVGGKELELTMTEFDILEMLMRAGGQVVPRSVIGRRLYQREITSCDRSVEVHVSNIRRKLGRHREYVKTVRDAGYIFVARGHSER